MSWQPLTEDFVDGVFFVSTCWVPHAGFVELKRAVFKLWQLGLETIEMYIHNRVVGGQLCHLCFGKLFGRRHLTLCTSPELETGLTFRTFPVAAFPTN